MKSTGKKKSQEAGKREKPGVGSRGVRKQWFVSAYFWSWKIVVSLYFSISKIVVSLYFTLEKAP